MPCAIDTGAIEVTINNNNNDDHNVVTISTLLKVGEKVKDSRAMLSVMDICLYS